MRSAAHPCWWCGLPNVREGSIPARILDLLKDSGSWWTIQAIVDRLAVPQSAVQRAVHRYSPMIERRRVRGHQGFEYRWKP